MAKKIAQKIYTMFWIAFFLNILTVTTIFPYLFKKGQFLMKNCILHFWQFAKKWFSKTKKVKNENLNKTFFTIRFFLSKFNSNLDTILKRNVKILRKHAKKQKIWFSGSSLESPQKPKSFYQFHIETITRSRSPSAPRPSPTAPRRRRRPLGRVGLEAWANGSGRRKLTPNKPCGNVDFA